MNQYISLYSVFRKHLAISDERKWIYWESDGTFPRIEYHMRVNSAAIFLCKTGYIDVEINQKRYHITPQFVTVLLPEHIVRIIKISGDYSGCSLIADQTLWKKAQREVGELTPYYSTAKEMPIIPITLEQFSLLLNYYNIFKEKYSLPFSALSSIIIEKVTVILFYEIYQLYSYVKEHMPTPSREEKTLQNFIKLVAANFKKERNINYYSSYFQLTPKYLSAIIKKASQTTASEWIDNYVIAEACVLLRTTNLSIKEISEELNFPDQSSFGKYFKRRKGISPHKYKAY